MKVALTMIHASPFPRPVTGHKDVIAGLDPAIQAFVDARIKFGHDEEEFLGWPAP
jgi:hypothetical protein